MEKAAGSAYPLNAEKNRCDISPRVSHPQSAGVSIYFCVAAKSILLALSRPANSFANCVGILFHQFAPDITIFQRRNFDMEIGAIGPICALQLHFREFVN